MKPSEALMKAAVVCFKSHCDPSTHSTRYCCNALSTVIFGKDFDVLEDSMRLSTDQEKLGMVALSLHYFTKFKGDIDNNTDGWFGDPYFSGVKENVTERRILSLLLASEMAKSDGN